MPNLVRAGYVAAIRQFAAVLVVGLIIIILTKFRVFGGQAGGQISLFFAYADILIAIGVISTCDRSSMQTAKSIRRASRTMQPTDPNRASDVLRSFLWILTAGCAILTLTPPPTLLVQACSYAGLPRVAWIGWPGAMSICVAALGANARAATRAFAGPK